MLPLNSKNLQITNLKIFWKKKIQKLISWLPYQTQKKNKTANNKINQEDSNNQFFSINKNLVELFIWDVIIIITRAHPIQI